MPLKSSLEDHPLHLHLERKPRPMHSATLHALELRTLQLQTVTKMFILERLPLLLHTESQTLFIARNRTAWLTPCVNSMTKMFSMARQRQEASGNEMGGTETMENSPNIRYAGQLLIQIQS